VKPTLDLYIGRRVLAVEQDEAEDWKWEIHLGGKDGSIVKIMNKSRDETMPPIHVVGCIVSTISMSLYDTTISCEHPGNGALLKFSLKPTQYAILDPKFGGEAYPQWPEELEAAGIPSHPDEEVSAEPSEDWPEEERRLAIEQHQRQQDQARTWLREDMEDAS